MRIKFWGVRGSIPSPSTAYNGFSTEIYGGNTSCIEVSTPSIVIALDAGTGIGNSAKLFSANPGDIHANIWALIVFQYWWKKNLSP